MGDFARLADASNDDRYPVLDDRVQILFQAVVVTVNDQVHRVWCDEVALGTRFIRTLFDLCQPSIEIIRITRIQCREAPDHTGHAFGDDKVGIGDYEHRRGNRRKRELIDELLKFNNRFGHHFHR